MKVANNGGPLMQAMGDKTQRVKQVTAPYEKRLENAKDIVEQTGEQITALEKLKILVQNYTVFLPKFLHNFDSSYLF